MLTSVRNLVVLGSLDQEHDLTRTASIDRQNRKAFVRIILQPLPQEHIIPHSSTWTPDSDPSGTSTTYIQRRSAKQQRPPASQKQSGHPVTRDTTQRKQRNRRGRLQRRAQSKAKTPEERLERSTERRKRSAKILSEKRRAERAGETPEARLERLQPQRPGRRRCNEKYYREHAAELRAQRRERYRKNAAEIQEKRNKENCQRLRLPDPVGQSSPEHARPQTKQNTADSPGLLEIATSKKAHTPPRTPPLRTQPLGISPRTGIPAPPTMKNDGAPPGMPKIHVSKKPEVHFSKQAEVHVSKKAPTPPRTELELLDKLLPSDSNSE